MDRYQGLKLAIEARMGVWRAGEKGGLYSRLGLGEQRGYIDETKEHFHGRKLEIDGSAT